MERNGKRVPKAEAKRTIARTLSRFVLGQCRLKDSSRAMKCCEMSPKIIGAIQQEMDEYGFSRRSIHDTTECIFVHYTEEQLKDLHDFCYTKLRDGVKGKA